MSADAKITVPETVILDMQDRARARKHELAVLKERLKAKQSELASAQIDVDRAEAALREVADFLQEHNYNAVDSDTTWHAELNLPPKLPPKV